MELCGHGVDPEVRLEELRRRDLASEDRELMGAALHLQGCISVRGTYCALQGSWPNARWGGSWSVRTLSRDPPRGPSRLLTFVLPQVHQLLRVWERKAALRRAFQRRAGERSRASLRCRHCRSVSFATSLSSPAHASSLRRDNCYRHQSHLGRQDRHATPTTATSHPSLRNLHSPQQTNPSPSPPSTRLPLPALLPILPLPLVSPFRPRRLLPSPHFLLDHARHLPRRRDQGLLPRFVGELVGRHRGDDSVELV